MREIKGIAAAQETPFFALTCFILGIYNFTLENYCTVFTCKGKEDVIFSRNSDFSTNLKNGYDSCFYAPENSYFFVGNPTAMVQIEDGVNQRGLAVKLTFCYPTVIALGPNAGALGRYCLEKCKTVEECIAAVEKLSMSSTQTLIFADKTGSTALMECNCKEKTVIYPGERENFVAATNEFQIPSTVKYRCNLPDTIFSKKRYEVVTFTLRNEEVYSPKFARDLLAGRHGFMCQYDREKLGIDTVCSTVILLHQNKRYRCEENPSR